MILTTCWVCAAPLDQNWLGKCVRCDTRYCSQACLRQHPDEECRSITRGGGAEQYHADKKYKEAVAVAVEECAEDTAGHRAGQSRRPRVAAGSLAVAGVGRRGRSAVTRAWTVAAVAREASEGPVAVAIAVALARPAPAVAREASEGPVAVTIAVTIAARAVSGVATAGTGVNRIISEAKLAAHRQPPRRRRHLDELL